MKQLKTLVDLEFPPTLDTSQNNLIKDFFVPALSHATKYDRGVGYFSSGWLRAASEGMATFAERGGKARWVTSPILDKDDWQALERGSQAQTDSVLRAVLTRNIADLSRTLQNDTLTALAWMVADGIISFKLALPQHKLERGDFHDKFGIFEDSEGNQLAFNGSYNDSIQGTRNYESIKIFPSWNPAFKPIVAADVTRFERLWSQQDPNVRVYDLPEAAREQILQLRNSARPYSLPSNHAVSIEWPPRRRNTPTVPDSIVLRDYQNDAIESWFKNGSLGLLEMATGTGKTITSLVAAVRQFDQQNRLALIVTVPYQHLVEQWDEEARRFGFRPVLAYSSRERWVDTLNHQILDFNAGHRPALCVITTHDTFASESFVAAIARIREPVMLLADEAHHLGAERRRAAYPKHIIKRLALSATPDRWFDDLGTIALRAYFGSTVFSFPLEKAIGVSLTPYYYYPHLVQLNEEELDNYEKLSLKIARLIARGAADDTANSETLRLHLVRRAQLLNKAEGKLAALSDLVDKQLQVDSFHIQHTLFYCAPGQIDEVLHLLCHQKHIEARLFTSRESSRERQRLLGAFREGEVQALVAMKCLDEGVDVPDTRCAYFLASSSNPREFIQRRGRVLRKAAGKNFSIIHDLLAVPPTVLKTADSPALAFERSIIRRELGRFKEFSDAAMNKYQALEVMSGVAARYNLMDF